MDKIYVGSGATLVDAVEPIKLYGDVREISIVIKYAPRYKLKASELQWVTEMISRLPNPDIDVRFDYREVESQAENVVAEVRVK